MLRVSNVAGLQHCNIRKNSVGKSDKSVVRENLFAIADIPTTSSIVITAFETIATGNDRFSCTIDSDTNPLKDEASGVEYIEAMTVKATATKKHIICDTNDVGTFTTPYSLFEFTAVFYFKSKPISLR